MTEDEPIKILDKIQIKQKVKRLAIEIMEQNFGEKQLILAGINNNGLVFAKLLQKELKKISDSEIVLTRIRLNPAKPLESEIEIEIDVQSLKNKVVIIVDDVANTGRTLFYALEPLLKTVPKKVELVVLVDRTHKSFPVRADYVGLALATTLQENINVQIRDTADWAVFLD
jgi:pyrimidine operon attenuation protein/uracil phosphoribosyltransferase